MSVAQQLRDLIAATRDRGSPFTSYHGGGAVVIVAVGPLHQDIARACAAALEGSPRAMAELMVAVQRLRGVGA